MTLLLLNTNVSAIENCCKRTLITFKAKKYNKLTFTSNEYLQPFSFGSYVSGYDVITCRSKQIFGCTLFRCFFDNFMFFLDIPNYSDMFDYIKGKWPAVYFNNQKIVAYHL